MEIPEFKPEDSQLRHLYNEVYPPKEQLFWHAKYIYEIWPELFPHKESIHVVYAGLGPPKFNERKPENIAEEIRTEYKNGKKNFVFVCLDEGLPIGNIQVLHMTCNLITDLLPNISLIYATGAFDGDIVYQEFCKRHNLTEFLKIICGANFEKNTSRGYSYYNIDYVPGHRDKKFLCFNKENRQHRITLFNKLLELDLVKDSYYSFYLTDRAKMSVLSMKENPFSKIIEIIDELPLVLNRTEERNNPVDIRDDDLKYFENTYFSVIPETLFFGHVRKPGHPYINIAECLGKFPSEKIYKAIALRHPFVLVGVHGFLKALHSRGYKTFSPYIDESYDDIEDDDLRLEAVVGEINRLCSLSDEQLIEFTHNVKSIVDHNYKVFSTVSDFKITKDVLSLLK